MKLTLLQKYGNVNIQNDGILGRGRFQFIWNTYHFNTNLMRQRKQHRYWKHLEKYPNERTRDFPSIHRQFGDWIMLKTFLTLLGAESDIFLYSSWEQKKTWLKRWLLPWSFWYDSIWQTELFPDSVKPLWKNGKAMPLAVDCFQSRWNHLLMESVLNEASSGNQLHGDWTSGRLWNFGMQKCLIVDNFIRGCSSKLTMVILDQKMVSKRIPYQIYF